MENCSFDFGDSQDFCVTPEIRQCFIDHGFILVKNILSVDEVVKLRRFMEDSSDIQKKAYERSDGQGRYSKMALWNKATDDVAGIVARFANWFSTLDIQPCGFI